jgi:hypothetical protein
MKLSPLARVACLLAAFTWIVAVIWLFYGDEVVRLVAN